MQCELCHQKLEPDAPIYRVARWDFGAFVSELRHVLRDKTSSRQHVDEKPSMANPCAVQALRASSHPADNPIRALPYPASV